MAPGRLKLFLNDQAHSTLEPDWQHYPHLKHPPFFADLKRDGSSDPELRIEGYLGDKRVISRSFSSDPAADQLLAFADDMDLVSDGSDATRLVFMAADKFGALRPFVGGLVTLDIAGPGIIIGDNPFELGDNGGAAAVWVKTKPDAPGRIQVTASHAILGTRRVEIDAHPAY
jgi:beta-galactosidase